MNSGSSSILKNTVLEFKRQWYIRLLIWPDRLSLVEFVCVTADLILPQYMSPYASLVTELGRGPSEKRIPRHHWRSICLSSMAFLYFYDYIFLIFLAIGNLKCLQNFRWCTLRCHFPALVILQLYFALSGYQFLGGNR